MADAARRGELKIDDELHLSALPAQDEAPEVTDLLKHLAEPPHASARFQRCGFGSKNKWTPNTTSRPTASQ